MRELFKALNNRIKEKKDTVMVTVVASSGSTPRGAGARMLVGQEGRIIGTIGGGAVEYQAIVAAMEVLKTKNSYIKPFYLSKNNIEDIGMICGGNVKVYFSYIDGNDTSVIELTDRIEQMYENGEASWLIIDISEDSKGELAVYGKASKALGYDIVSDRIYILENKPKQIELDGRKYYIEKLAQSGIVYIFGGGHVSQALVPVLKSIDFRCVVLEDREEFCKKELFKGVEKTMLIDNERVLDYIDVSEDDYICIMTRGHKADTIVQAQALKTAAKYIGVIGSARKVKGVFDKLKEMGFTDKDLKRIVTPIGLEIKAETPEEIAISIAAQLIMVRANTTNS